MSDTVIKTVKPDFDLGSLSEVELVQTMGELCEELEKCYYEMIPAYDDVWDSIKRVSEEILRRTKQEVSEYAEG